MAEQSNAAEHSGAASGSPASVRAGRAGTFDYDTIPVAAIDAEAGMYSWLALPVLIHVINRRQRADAPG